MNDDTTPTDIDRINITDISDVTDNNLITDFTQIVSCLAGKNRIERRRQKIREELIREYINAEKQVSPSLISQLFNIFRRN